MGRNDTGWLRQYKKINMKDKQVSSKALIDKFYDACESFSALSIVWLILILLFSTFENVFNSTTHGLQSNFFSILVWSFLMDVFYWLRLFLFLFIIYTIVFFISAKIAKVLLQALIVLLFLIQAGLMLYFNTSLVLLGADLYNYSIKDIEQTLGASGGVSVISISILVILILTVISALYFLPKKIKIKKTPALALPILSILFLFIGVKKLIAVPSFKSDFENNLILNKSDYFISASYEHFFSTKFEVDIYADSYIGDFGENEIKIIDFEYVDDVEYPFLHKYVAQDVLSPFFQTKKDTLPNIVIILVEGLGQAYSNKSAYLGSFTPFIDSLSNHSLYWENMLSQGGRTFAVLPSILGSLPFAKNGFLELENPPKQLSLLSLLKLNGYQTSFYYSGDASFDRMGLFLKENKIDEIRDEKTFPSGYLKLPSQNGFTWGYNDKELFRYFLSSRSATENKKPQFSVVLTVSTHSPFLINESNKYEKLFENRMNTLNFPDSQKDLYRKYQSQYSSILYMDDALRYFIKEYQKREDFSNTIFMITGDHRMPEIPMSTKIDRFHVPFIIYSPMLKRTETFSSISSHFDIPSTILSFLNSNNQIKMPMLSSWIGEGLDTGRVFGNSHRIPLMQNKNDIVDFVMGEYHLNGNDLFKLNQQLEEEKVDDEARKNQMINEFNLFKIRNTSISNGGKLIPDTLYKKYTLPN